MVIQIESTMVWFVLALIMEYPNSSLPFGILHGYIIHSDAVVSHIRTDSGGIGSAERNKADDVSTCWKQRAESCLLKTILISLSCCAARGRECRVVRVEEDDAKTSAGQQDFRKIDRQD